MQVLEGIKVVDLSWTKVGAQATQVMADFGAEVLWIEPPSGSRMRIANGFPLWGRGKQSLVLDLNSEEGRQRFLEIIATADVLVETFRHGQMEEWGLGYETLAALNPRLIHGTISGFGSMGPYRDVPAYEALVMAKLGIMAQFKGMTDEDHPPCVSVPWCSFSASMVLLEGLLAAIYERETSGLGQSLETNMVQAFAALDTWGWYINLINTRFPDAYPSAESFDEEGIPQSPLTYMLLIALTKDGKFLQFAQVAAHLYVAFMKSLGLEGMFADPAWEGIPRFDIADRERREGLWRIMLEKARERTLAEWLELFEENPDVFGEQFRSGPEVLDHPQLEFDGFVTTIEQPGIGPIRQPGPLVKMTKTPAQVGRPAPGVGEHDPDLLVRWAATASEGKVAPSTEAPLAGVTILEMAQLFAAPYGATMLGDLGARVIKVEPLEGDMIRGIIPFPESGGAKVMQGKESICIDMTTPEGLEIVYKLAAISDVVLQGFRAGAAERAKIDAASLHEINPDLVYLHAPGYGDGGPYGHRPAYAPSIGAAGGIARAALGASVPENDSLTMEEIMSNGRRLSVGAVNQNAQADGFAALGVANALMLGLVAKARGAGGQAMLSTMISTCANAMSDFVLEYPGMPGPLQSDEHFWGMGPLYRSYATNDGFVFLAAPQEKEWRRLVGALAPYVNLAADDRFHSEERRLENADALSQVLANVFATRSKRDWEPELLGADVGCMVVETDMVEAIISGELGAAHGYLSPTDHPTFGEHDRVAPAVRFSRSATKADGGALAGTATRALMEELGYSAEQIDDLAARNVIGAA